MKTYEKIMLVLFLCGLAVSAFFLFAVPAPVHVYSAPAVVVEVNYKTDVVTVEGLDGNLWEFGGCEDWAEGDVVDMAMSDNGTPRNIYDDEIIGATYCGTIWG